MLGVALVAPLELSAQHRGSNRTSQSSRPTSGTRAGGNSSSRPGMSRSGGSERKAQPARTMPSTRPGGSLRNEGMNARPATRPATRPGSASGEQTRPGNHGSNRPQTGNTRPGNSDFRPNTGGNHGNNQTGTRPGNNGTRPGNNGNHNGNHGGNLGGNHNGNRPGHGGNHGGQIGGNHGRPDRPGHGGGVRPDRPGHGNPGFRPGGNSAPRPGGWAHVSRPHYNYRNPGYRPPRPGGGYWGAPPPSPYRINYWVPPVPRYVRVVRTVPSIGTILGLTFGSFIDAGINALYNAGYTVNGYYNDAIYLSNVRQLGYLWPEAIVQYNDGLMSGTQFYNWSSIPDQNMYYSLYNQLTASYGTPVDISYSNSGPTATWWGGGNTGYITLSYGYGPSATGLNNYYTSLTYTAY